MSLAESRALVCDEEMDEAEFVDGHDVASSESSLCANQEEHAAKVAARMVLANDEEDEDEEGMGGAGEVVTSLSRTASHAPGRIGDVAPFGDVARKRPLWRDFCEEDEAVLESPDLAQYFDQFENMPDESRIAICRTYANYLAAKLRRLKPPQKRQKN